MSFVSDYRNRMITPGHWVLIRQGVYAGYRARITSIEGRRITLSVEADIPTSINLDRRSMERES